MGVIAEMKLMWDALPGLAKSGAYSIGLPNAWNFAFSYSAFIKLVLLVYPFLWWQLYSQLLSQRRKKVGSSGGARKRD